MRYLALLLLGLTACHHQARLVAPERAVQTPATFSHAAFDAVLQQYVTDGWVDYAGLRESGALTPYLETLAATDPARLPAKEQFAFWLNAYNALTLKLILDHYPTESILDVTPLGFTIPKLSSPFEAKAGYVGGEVLTLDHIEHGILRKQFDDPRLHFALVCAAVSCPPLRSEAYVGDRLDAQLDDQARRFLHDRSKNVIPADDGTIRLSKIFDWFAKDFGDDARARQRFLAPYFEGEARQRLLDGAYRIRYTRYDWTLNDQRFADERPPALPVAQ